MNTFEKQMSISTVYKKKTLSKFSLFEQGSQQAGHGRLGLNTNQLLPQYQVESIILLPGEN